MSGKFLNGLSWLENEPWRWLQAGRPAIRGGREGPLRPALRPGGRALCGDKAGREIEFCLILSRFVRACPQGGRENKRENERNKCSGGFGPVLLARFHAGENLPAGIPLRGRERGFAAALPLDAAGRHDLAADLFFYAGRSL